MSIRVKLSDVLFFMESQSDETSCYLDMKTGQIERVSDYDFRAAESDDAGGDSSAGQWKEVQAARRIIENKNNFLLLPTPQEIHEYSIMEEFCGSVDDGWMSERLFAAITGKGAFRRFKIEIRKLGIEDDWYEYRDQALKDIAVQWCEDNDLEYIDE